MNMINDGGPAFPVWELNGNGQPEMTGFGMTLRDYFAAKAMHAIITEPIYEGAQSFFMYFKKRLGLKGEGMDAYSQVAYAMADAMLRASEQQYRESVNADLMGASKEAEAALRNVDANMNEQIAAAIASDTRKNA